MTTISYGDLAQSFLLRRQNVTTKTEMQLLQTEVVTGQSRDITAKVRGDVVPLAGLDASVARLNGYQTLAREQLLVMGAMQTALNTVHDLSSNLAEFLIGVSTGVSETRVAAAGTTARSNLETVVSALNTRFGDRSIFSGMATSSPALADANSLLSAAETAITGLTAPADIETALGAWFDSPTGFEANVYQGGAPLAPLSVAAGEEASMPITALDPAIKATLKGLTMAALLDRGLLAGNFEERQNIANRAGLSLLQTNTDRAYLTGRLGAVEAQVQAAAARNSAEVTSLEIVRNDITLVDPYEAASKLQDTQSQLEKIYTLTARMTRLSLMDYL
ncbi:MAG: flagellin [Cypionkella sp.]|nr:flagellin [Cypionkella sp.]